jgi:NTE family protein
MGAAGRRDASCAIELITPNLPYEDRAMNDDTTEVKIGLALSGGAILGAAHVGVLRVLEEEGIRTGWVAGTSAGAIVGALYAFGLPVSEIESLTKELSWLSVTNLHLSRMGLLSNAKLGEFLRDTLGDVDIEDAQVPFAAVAADIHTGEKQVLRTGNLAEAVTASACIPGIFSPVVWEDHLLVDGGIVENLPVDTVRSLGADRVLGVDLYTAGLYPEPRSIIDVILNSSSILLANTRLLDMQEQDVIVRPQLTAYNAVDSRHIPDLIDEGYRAARDAVDDILTLVG